MMLTVRNSFAAVAAMFCLAAGAFGAARPNVVLIFADDLELDIGETRNLIAQNPEVVKQLRQILDSGRKQAKGINGVAWPRP